MKKIKKLLATIIIGVMAFGAVSCSMIEKTPEAIKNTVIAKVNGEKITKGDIDQELKSYIDQFKSTYGEDFESNPEVKAQLDEYRKQVVENLVSEKVLIMKAEELDLAPKGDELTKEVEKKTEELKNLYGSQEALQSAIDSYGYTDETFKTFMENQVIAQKTIEYIQKDITVTDEEIATYYNENVDTFKTEAGAEVSHILLGLEGTTEASTDEEKAAAYEKALVKANEVREKLVNGGDFAELAAEYSTDTGSSSKGGSYGFIPYSSEQYVPEFMEGFKGLKDGEISQPVKSDFGYHVITVKGVQTEARTKTLEEAKETIKMQIEQTKQKAEYDEKIEEWKSELKVKLYLDKL